MSEQQWYVLIDGKQIGPITWEQLVGLARSGQLQRRHLLWRDGMIDWGEAHATPRLFEGAPPPQVAPGLHGSPPSLVQPLDPDAMSAAKTLCMVQFVGFLVAIGLVFVMAVETISSGRAPEQGRLASCASCSILVGGLFSLICLPLRWRHIMLLPVAYIALGLIGGFGMIAFLALAVLGLFLG